MASASQKSEGSDITASLKRNALQHNRRREEEDGHDVELYSHDTMRER